MSESVPRDQAAIERELRLLASVRGTHRERGKTMPSIDQMDALLDELIALRGRGGRHRWDSDESDVRPSLWR